MDNAMRAERIETIRSYFRLVDARDPALLDLFTDDVRFYFPKFGMAAGKAAVAGFGERIARELRSLIHDIDGLIFTVDGDRIVVEGQEAGVTMAGESWPDGEISQGRFCNVFEFDGSLISRTYIYVDPDFTSADQPRLQRYRDGGEIASPREVALRYLEAVGLYRAEPGDPQRLVAITELFSEDADWDIAGDRARVPWIGPRRGKAEIATFFRELISSIEPRYFEVRSVLADGERAVILGELASLVRATGRLIETGFAFDLTVRQGRIVRYRMLEDSYAVAQAA
ncbi:nuclear transport factor 2 family protein [Labrys neptuniae]